MGESLEKEAFKTKTKRKKADISLWSFVPLPFFFFSQPPSAQTKKNPRHHQNEKTRMDPSMMTMNPEAIRAAQAAMAKMSPEQRKPGKI